MKMLQININFKCQKVVCWIATITVPALTLQLASVIPIVHIIQGNIENFDYLFTILMNVLYVLRLFLGAQFVLACALTRHRFVLLRRRLVCVPITNGGCDDSKFLTVIKVYHDLCDMIATINSSFTFPFIVIFCNLMVSQRSAFVCKF
jgi:hypothetical protein